MEDLFKKDLTDEFYDNEEEWRIAAVIHDGEWYDIPKWRRVAKVSKSKLEEWINNNEDILITTGEGKNKSYRVSHDEVIKWYEEEGIPIETMLIPGNFPPKLWGNGMTEAEMFESKPRRRVGTLSFDGGNVELIEKCKRILDGVAIITPDSPSRWKAFGLSAKNMRNILTRELTEEEIEELDIKSRNILLQRELFDFPNDWAVDSLQFYIDYAETALKASKSTIEIYLPDRDDQKSQNVLWVISAMKKFDETKGVPFSGYLSGVLRFWPYDLPDEFLGKELSQFQRESRKAKDKAINNLGYRDDSSIPVKVLADIMDVDVEYYLKMQEQHNSWLKDHNSQELTWGDSANEKSGVAVGYEREVDRNIELLSIMSFATIKSAIESEDWESAYSMIEALDKNDIEADFSNISYEFQEKLQENIRKEVDKVEKG